MITSMSKPPELQNVLKGIAEIELAVLFGSAARGEATGRSDLDLGIRLTPNSATSLWDVEIAVGSTLGHTVDLVDLRRAPPLLRLEIARDGVVLVEREPGDWTLFKANAMIDWWDWAPTARKIHRISAERLREDLGDAAA